MRKIYPILNPPEVTNSDKNTDILNVGIPAWIKEEMQKIAKAENCSIRDLRYKRELYFNINGILSQWIDYGEISLEKDE